MVSINYKKDHVVKNKYSRPGMALTNVVAFVIHYTANPGATAQNHQDFFDGNDGGAYRYAGAHIFVDKREAIETIPLNEVAYHANDKSPRLSYLGPNANFSTIGIEMCIEKDGSFHPDTVKRTVLVVKQLHKTYPGAKVIRHYDVTGKNCPKPYVENPKAWQSFLDDVNAKPAPDTKVDSVVSTKPSKPKPKQYTSIVTYLNDHKRDSSFKAREKLAKEYGISGYKGTAAQNLKLLDLLQSGKKPSQPSKPKPVAKPASSLPNAVYRASKPYPTGAGVKAVQKALASVYFYPDKGAPNNGIDGVYGPKTADAVRRFQLIHGLTADGIYGPKTKAALERASK